MQIIYNQDKTINEDISLFTFKEGITVSFWMSVPDHKAKVQSHLSHS